MRLRVRLRVRARVRVRVRVERSEWFSGWAERTSLGIGIGG